jgi:hypothetical protein
MNNFKNCYKKFFDSVQGAQCNFRRKFGADRSIFKLSAILIGENHQYGVRGYKYTLSSVLGFLPCIKGTVAYLCII